MTATPFHSLQRAEHLLAREHVQRTRLLQLDRQALANRVGQHGVAGVVLEICNQYGALEDVICAARQSSCQLPTPATRSLLRRLNRQRRTDQRLDGARSGTRVPLALGDRAVPGDSKPQRAEQFVGRFEPIVRMLREQSADQLVVLRPELRPQRRHRRRLLVQDGAEDVDRRASGECPFPGQALEQHRAE